MRHLPIRRPLSGRRCRAISAAADRLRQDIREALLQLSERDAILRPLRSGHARLDSAEIELDHARIVDLARPRRAKAALRLEVGLDRDDLLVRTAGLRQIL